MMRLVESTKRLLGKGSGGSVRQRSARTVPAAVLAGSELVHLGGGETIACPGIESLPFAAHARHLGLGTRSLALPAPRVHVLHDVALCPGSRVVVDRKSHRIVAESITSDMIGRLDLVDSEFTDEPVHLDGTVAVFRSPWRAYFHTMVDHLPRAALLAQPALRRYGAIRLVHDGPLTDAERELLPRLLRDNIELVEVTPGRAVTADRILVPSYVTRPYCGALPSWYRRWMDRAVASVTATDPDAAPLPRRIYIDRVAPRRRVRNRTQLLEVLDKHDISVVDVTAMTTLERMSALRDASLVMGVTGSGMVNTIFCRRATVVEILPEHQLLPHFYYLAASKGLPYEFATSVSDGRNQSAEDRLTGDVVVDVAAIDAVLSRLD